LIKKDDIQEKFKENAINTLFEAKKHISRRPYQDIKMVMKDPKFKTKPKSDLGIPTDTNNKLI